MTRISFDGWKDPARRPRYIIWTGVGTLVLVAVMIVALGVTSTYWFCADGCHKVQDDTITAYQHSSHSEISCMSCHMPANSGPVTFLLHKVEALGELYLTVTGDYELPLNGESEVALEMPSTQCTQCHDERRTATPSRGIIIDHAVHAENDVSCTICHNRIAHREDFELELTDPKTGEPNRKHDDFMEMTACFRCHSLESDAVAPGACPACHPTDFELKPENHFEPGFYQAGGESAGHTKLANEALAATGEGTATAEPTATPVAHEEGEIPPVSSVFYCQTCHAKEFCSDCHGLPMPHPADFNEGHGGLGKSKPKVCANCHATGGESAQGLEFCNACHHPDKDPLKSWISQHFVAVRDKGAQSCFECHNPTYCAECHVRSIQ